MSNKNEVLELEAEEVSNNPLEATIEKELIKHNVTDAVINALTEKYGSMSLRSIDDKETYLEIKAARKEVRSVGIIAENICKIGRSDAVKVQKLWIKKENETLEKIALVQDKLDAEIKKFDDEVKRIEEEEAKRKEEAFIQRQSTLLKYGAKYENGSFVLNHISYESINIQEADEEVYADIILPKYKQQFEKNESVMVEEENKRAAEIEKLRVEKEAFEKQQAEFRLQQETFNKQKEEQEKLLRDEQQKINDAARLESQRISKERQTQLLELGLKFTGSSFSLSFIDEQPVNVSVDSIMSSTSEEWTLILEQVKPKVTHILSCIKLAEEQEIKRVEEAAIQKERERIEEQNKIEELNRLHKEELKQQELLKASDREKWDTVLFDIDLIKLPEFKSTIFKGKLNSLKSLIEQIKSL